MDETVLIVGAGPTGLTLAGALARFGVKIRIIDKAAAPTDKSKALVLWSRTLELLDRTGGAAPFIAAGRPVRRVNFMARGARLGQLSLSGIDSPYPFGLMLPQADTERLLHADLQSLGGQVERQVELVSFAESPGGVTAILRHADGGSETVSATWLAGCDGAHSTVRHALNLHFIGDTLQSDWILADLFLAGLPTPEDELAMFAHEDGILAVFPISPGRYRVIADTGGGGGARAADPSLAEVQRVIDRRAGPGITASNPIWLSGFRINERKVKEYRVGRVFLLGDAAHVHSPAGGQGMNTGMQDAFNLAWKLALVVQGAAGAALLDSYSAERSPVGAQVLKAAGRLTRVATLRGRPWQALRNGAARLLLHSGWVQRRMATVFSETAIHYPDSALNGPAAPGLRPAPGERMRPMPGDGPDGGKFTLYAAAGGVAGLPEDFPALLAARTRPPPGDGIWLVRPDGYVAATARRGEAVAIGDYLGRLMGG